MSGRAAVFRRRVTVLAGILGAAFLGWLLWRPVPAVVAPAAALRPPPPHLLPASASRDAPGLAWPRLLAEDGSPVEDLAALRDLTDAFLHSVPPAQRPPLGFDEDLARVLSDPRWLGEAALPSTHPALRGGRLIDRWGTPWHVHPLSSDVIQLRSAGPDGRLFTADDLVDPRSPPDEP